MYVAYTAKLYSASTVQVSLGETVDQEQKKRPGLNVPVHCNTVKVLHEHKNSAAGTVCDYDFD